MEFSVRIEVIEGRTPMTLSLRLPSSRVLELTKSSVFVGDTFDNHAALNKRVLNAMEPVTFAAVTVTSSTAQNKTGRLALSRELCTATSVQLSVDVKKLSCEATSKDAKQSRVTVGAKPSDVPTNTYQSLGDKMNAAMKSFEKKVRQQPQFAATSDAFTLELDYITSSSAYDIDHKDLTMLSALSFSTSAARSTTRPPANTTGKETTSSTNARVHVGFVSHPGVC
jgi:hypothetical protein